MQHPNGHRITPEKFKFFLEHNFDLPETDNFFDKRRFQVFKILVKVKHCFIRYFIFPVKRLPDRQGIKGEPGNREVIP